ncbi:MAG: AMP-binding protein [Porphyromonadaceae bacterium]|nr:AMP-binding protein [Porphyromonadaceae bacterium]
MVNANFISLYEEGFIKYWNSPALSNYEGVTYTYHQVAENIAKWHILFERVGLQRGQKVAIMGKDTAEWCTIFLATVTYGAVIVPVLQDFAPADAMSIIDHSESRLLFINDNLWEQMSLEQLPLVEHVIDLQSQASLASRGELEALSTLISSLADELAIRYPQGYRSSDVKYYHTPNSEVLLLNYTSGTTGFSKGVMVTGNNLAGNVMFCRDNDILHPQEDLLCFLPLAHTYSCMVHLLLAMTIGVHVTILGRVPTPKALGQALKKLKPQIIVSVPLVLEKIYQNAILPIIQQPKIKFMLSMPILKGIVHKKIRQKLIDGLGGCTREVIVGGAALNPEVGVFLKKIGFPITVGYGMTECAPLISYIPPSQWRVGSCGRVLRGYMEARIAPLEDGHAHVGSTAKDAHGLMVGEIQVRGENVCLGYYKNEEQTAALFTEDGWLKTGDLGSMDADNFLYIKGRSKTMLLGPSGQNIYPEEIEAKISLIPYVQESIVLMREGKLEALIVPNLTAIETSGVTEGEAWEVIKAHRAALNDQLGAYEKIQRFELRNEPFEKTPKQSIKRFLYS